MAIITKEEVLDKKYDFLSVTQYCVKYGGNITSQAVYYAMDRGLLDYLSLGREKLIVMTEHSKNYVPNASKKRLSL